ncbi:hypothetical protein P154DRAFT_623959 [Amniculicola lignicola CBS 123094]|uniref:Uncharacterized protein n=1 Tax=Amniculicola lignicola CBS 123094 TaxID=1392246 RepID=A0A6A5W363_9PLEO|nr:hypothetical protein P154DRAFT_623959 [Amniculicola lignicola CBS 123094]
MDTDGPSMDVRYPVDSTGVEAYDDILRRAFSNTVSLVNKEYNCWRKTGGGPDGIISAQDLKLQQGFRRVVCKILKDAIALGEDALNEILDHEDEYDEEEDKNREEYMEDPFRGGESSAMGQDISMDESSTPLSHRLPPAPATTPTRQSPVVPVFPASASTSSYITAPSALVGIPSFLTQLEENRIGAEQQATICANMISLLQSVGPVVDEAGAQTEEVMLHGCQNAIRFELMPKASECIKRSVRMLRARGQSKEDVQLNALEAGLGALNL